MRVLWREGVGARLEGVGARTSSEAAARGRWREDVGGLARQDARARGRRGRAADTRKSNKYVTRFFESHPEISNAETAMFEAKREMMRCQRVLQEFLGETSVSPSLVYPGDSPIGDHAMMETVNRQQNRVIDTIHRGLSWQRGVGD